MKRSGIKEHMMERKKMIIKYEEQISKWKWNYGRHNGRKKKRKMR